MKALKIFVPADRIPRPDESGGDSRFLAMLEILARRHRVDFCVAEPLSAREMARARALLNAIGVRFLTPGWRSFAYLRCSSTGTISACSSSTGLQSDSRVCFKPSSPQALVVVDSVDVHFARDLAAADLGLIDRQIPESTRRRKSPYTGPPTRSLPPLPYADPLGQEGGIGPIFAFRSSPHHDRASCGNEGTTCSLWAGFPIIQTGMDSRGL